MQKNISDSTAGRLPMYYRCLRELIVSDHLRVSSAELGKKLGITPSQVRADLASFGRLGQQGYGYYVKPLYVEISRLLGVGDNMQAIILASSENGVSALYPLFEGRGITLRAAFFDMPGCGEKDDGEFPFVYRTERLEEYLDKNQVDIAMVMPDKSSIHDTAAILEKGGVIGVLNLSNTDMHSDIMKIKNMPIGDVLMSVCYAVKNKKSKKTETYGSDE